MPFPFSGVEPEPLSLFAGRANKKPRVVDTGFLNSLAERTGLEPTTPGVTGRYSNQLNYRSAAVNGA